MIKEIDKENDVEIDFSGIVHQEDRDYKDMIDDTNKKMKSYCASVGIGLINNANFDSSCVNRSKLHLIRKCSGLLRKNISGDGVFINAKIYSSEILNILRLENLRDSKSPKRFINVLFNKYSVRNIFSGLTNLIFEHVFELVQNIFLNLFLNTLTS